MKKRSVHQLDGIKMFLAVNHPHLPTYTLWPDGWYTRFQNGKDVPADKSDVLDAYIKNECYIEVLDSQGGARCARYQPDEFDNSWFERLKVINRAKTQPQSSPAGVFCL